MISCSSDEENSKSGDSIVQSSDEGYVNGHAYVDLCLPSGLKWATMNVGATNVTDYGDYYAWGETKAYGEEDQSNARNYSYANSYTKTYYYWNTYKWCNGSGKSLTKYCTDPLYGTEDGKITLDPEDDAATQNWGGKWRMPTSEEWTELLYNCYWKWVDSYNDSGVAGYIGYVAKSPSDKGMVTQGYNGYYPASLYSAYLDTHIFLPAAGVYSYSSHSEVNVGSYWSSSLRRQNNRGSSILFCFEVHDTGKRIDDKDLHLFVTSDDRYYGQSVRAVCE